MCWIISSMLGASIIDNSMSTSAITLFEMVGNIFKYCEKLKNTPGSFKKAKWPAIDLAYHQSAPYEYYLLSASSMSTSIVVIDQHVPKPEGVDDPDIPPPLCYRYPFKTLGVIKSHVLPHYAIFNCGRKLHKASGATIYDLAERYELITGNAAEARVAWRQIAILYDLWTKAAFPPMFKATFEKNMRQEPEPSSPPSSHERDDYKPPKDSKKRKASGKNLTSSSRSRMGSNSGANKRQARHTVFPPPHDPDSDCSINSDAPLMEAEVMEMHDSLELVSSWRTANSQKFSQGYRREKTIASRKDIGEYTGEPPRKASTVDLNPKGAPVDYYPAHLVAAALQKIERLTGLEKVRKPTMLLPTPLYELNQSDGFCFRSVDFLFSHSDMDLREMIDAYTSASLPFADIDEDAVNVDEYDEPEDGDTTLSIRAPEPSSSPRA
ncbi:hypothetical protein HWV62_30985 [Athelia sp. TMB]|nr:hypothetical protein HWV62_30985 [Athelia sp. TMB]